MLRCIICQLQLTVKYTSLHSSVNINPAHRPQSTTELERYPQAHFPSSSRNAMDMRSLTGALPEYSSHPHPKKQEEQHQQSFQHTPIPGGHGQGAIYEIYTGAQFAGQAVGAFNLSLTQQTGQRYAQSQHQQRAGNFPCFVVRSSAEGQPQSFQEPALQGLIQSFPAHPHMQQFLHPQSSSRRDAGYNSRGYQHPQRVAPMGLGTYQSPAPNSKSLSRQLWTSLTAAAVTRTRSNSSMRAMSPSVLRGPPRKPRQSGHALWVGNLPPGTDIVDLKDHFSRDATDDIESVFFISKSSCAFVNYKSEDRCQAAMSRFHDSRFRNVRLVCRLRRGSGSSAPSTPQTPRPVDPPPKVAKGEQDTVVDGTTTKLESLTPPEKVKEKYFVVKSLTIEDLDRSVQSGVWATQAHNEAALSQAYEVC